MATFSERLDELMEERDVSIRALSNHLYLSHTTVQYYRKGRSQPSADTIIRMCQFFGVSADYLLGLSCVRQHDIYGIANTIDAAYAKMDEIKHSVNDAMTLLKEV